ncbi:MAG: GntR family transcriptional regulator [Acidobacteria bacterium]|nr:MAG: GntR family transcriptional regulator [Acidobacteriota bacterium]PYY05902.1 MAG: GntR family transcriptional regulator [Acidobacteriota bacterium]
MRETASVQTRKKKSAISAVKPNSNHRHWEFAPLDKSSFTPMYFQIQTQLLKMIQSGRLRPGDALPSEDELSRACAVSRMTARHALQALKTQGFASRHKGQGTFVSQPKVEKDIMHLAGFTAEMRALGLQPSSRVLSADMIPAPAEVASGLRIEIGSPVFHLRRLRCADGVPVAIEEVWLSREQFPGLDKIDFASASLYQTLRERYGIRVTRADEILEARSATRQQAELLEIPRHASLLAITRTLWSVEGKPVETAHSVYRGDRYRAVLAIPATAVE